MVRVYKNNIAEFIFYSIISFGLYQIVWLYMLVKNIRAIKKDDSNCLGEMLCLMLVPFYPLYWWYSRGKFIREKFAGEGHHHARGKEKTYLVLGIFGLSLISMAIMQSDFNRSHYKSADPIRLKPVHKNLINRTLDIIGVEIFLSLLAMSLYFADFYVAYDVVFWASLTVTVVYLGWTVYCLFRFRLKIEGKKDFFKINAPIYGVLFASAIITSLFDTEPYYTFLFMPFKLFHFAALSWSFPGAGHLSRPVSALLVSVIIAIPLVLIPAVITSRRKQKVKYIESHK